MSTNFPTSLDTSTQLPDIAASDDMNATGKEHDVIHTNVNDAVIALQTKVGIDGSADTTSLDYKINNGAKTRLFNYVTNTTNNSWGNYTLRLAVPGYMMVNGSRIRFTLATSQSTSTTLGVSAAYIGNSQNNVSGYPIDYVGTPVSVTFGGSLTGSCPGKSALTSDWMSFACSQNTSIVIGIQFTSGDAAGANAFDSGLMSYEYSGNNAGGVSNSGYTIPTSIWFFKSVEVA